MRAIVQHEYGSPADVLELREVDKPVVRSDEVLVRVHASSANMDDLEFVRGSPFVRPAHGLRRPKYGIPGADMAGRVEAIGKNVTRFEPGDEVFADLTEWGFGAFAEYASVPERALARKPSRMTFEEAAAVPSAGVRALQGLRGKRQIRPGQKVLINGGGGGLGTFVIQIARSLGAEVTGVDSTKKLDFMRSVGADHVLDYTQGHFTASGQRFDLILDVATYGSFEDLRPLLDCERVLTREGRYVVYMVGGFLVRVFQAIFLRPWMKLAGSRKMSVLLGRPNDGEDLAFLTELIEAGKLESVIDKRVDLSEVPAALGYVEAGRAQGKVVITI